MSELDRPTQFRQSDGSLTTESHDKEYMEIALRSGKHSDLVKKLMKQRIEQRAKEFPRWPGEITSGTRTLWIESRFWYDRERMLPDFDDDWRRYRSKYLHSLELDPREPINVPEYEREFLNPIRRFYMKGGDFIEDKIIKRFTNDRWQSATYRVTITRLFMIYCGAIGLYYYVRFNQKQWCTNKGPQLVSSAPIIYPNHPKFPFQDYRTLPTHHYDLGFTRRQIYKDLRDYEDRTVTL